MITIKDYVKTYKSVTLTFPSIVLKKRLILLIGQNGSGKTTLLKSLANLLSYEGSIYPKKSYFYLSESVSFPEKVKLSDYLMILKELTKADKDRLDKLLTTFKLKEHQSKLIEELSKGMRQKLHLVQSFMVDRDVYLLGEPTNGLDEDTLIKLKLWFLTHEKMLVIATHSPTLFVELKPQVIKV